MLRRKVECVFGEMRKIPPSGSKRHVNDEIYVGDICFTSRITGVYLRFGCLGGARLWHNSLIPNRPVIDRTGMVSSLLE
jgi:hypothetical protein